MAEALVAAAVVIHRRTLRDSVVVAHHDERLPRGTWTLDMSDAPSFDGLLRAVRAPGAAPEPTPDGAEDADVTLRTGRTEPGAPGDAESLGIDRLGTVMIRRLPADRTDELRRQLERALMAGRTHPNRPVSALSLASDTDRELVRVWGGRGVPAGAPRTIPDLVGEWVIGTPDAVAVSAESGKLTYRQLGRAADLLAGRLIAAGAGPERVVGVLAGRSPRLIVALLAILKAGAAYLVLDPQSPPARRAVELADAAASLAVVDEGPQDRTLPDGVTAVPLEAFGDTEFERTAPVRLPGLSPAHLAYVSYTSGSTGAPKPVGIPHSAVCRLVRSPDWARFESTDVFLQTAPVAFDASVLEIWGSLANGAELVLPPPGRIRVDRLAEIVAEAGVSVLWLTAGLFQQFAFQHCERLRGVRQLITGGDVVPPAAVARVLGEHPSLIVTNGYGPTENTTFTTCAALGLDDTTSAVPIGRPIDGTRVLLLDPRLQPVPVGVVGELYAAGAGLARGYLGRPGVTAERFIPDPTGARPGARLYRTGDLARWRPDGSLDFLGRADRQVKVNGYRIEPAEIETALTGHPAVRAATVTARPGPGGATRLVAYVEPEDAGHEPRSLGQELKRRLRELLPPPYLPSWITVLAELPLTANGKVDLDALPESDLLPRAAMNDYVAPRTPDEQLMCDLWADVLGIEAVGIEDDFFELGGHSLIAAELLAVVQQETGLELSARTLYLSPTVAELTELGAFTTPPEARCDDAPGELPSARLQEETG
ncbi:non-ribosomal peptide synthetase [Streptomyces albicerus]|uniref:non-ribosomal peptide synthetase n=1 Tax=Streptomyces albicerus TaxID=2569859 RepID=UPI001CEDE556|nr:non-ribosomal peptide synthetase [Streptomyces albicerus]